MMVALFPEQVTENWEAIKVAIERSMPPIAPVVDMAKVLESILAGRMQVWVVLNDMGNIVCVVSTTVSEDYCSGSKSLVIYSLYAVGRISPKNWKEGFETLKAHARAIGCSGMSAYTTEEVVRKLVRFFGGDDSFTYLRMEV